MVDISLLFFKGLFQTTPAWIYLQCRRPGFDLWVGKIPWRREQLPTPVFWPGEFHGSYCPWGHEESDTTEWLSLSLFRQLIQLHMVKLTIAWSSHFLDMALLFLCCMPLHILPIKNHHLSVIIFKKKWMMVLFSLMFPLCWIVIASYSPRAANLRCLFCVSLCLRKHCSLFVFLHVQVKAWTLLVCSFLSRSKDDFQKTSWRPWGICLR